MHKLIRELKRKSLLGYILSFSAIVVLIILIMGSYIYRFYYRTIYSDFLENNENYLSAVYTRHENDMEVVDNIVTQINLIGSNAEFVLRKSPMKSISLEEQLKLYTSVSQFFKQVYYFYHGDKYLYNYATSMEVDRFLTTGMQLENTSKEQFRKLLYSEERGLKVLPEQRIKGYLAERYGEVMKQGVIFIKPVEPRNTSSMVFLVPASYYDDLLKEEAENLRQNYIIFNNQIIMSRGSLNLDNETLLKELIDRKETQFQIYLDNQKYLITMQQADNGLLYGTVQSMKIFQNKIVTGLWGILLVLAICSIPTSVIIVALFRRLSKKIRNINALLSEDEKTYYNLENIETGIRMLVEDNKVVHKESLPLRRTKFISTFIRNEYADRNAVILAGSQIGIQVDRTYFAVALMGERENSNEQKAHEMMLSVIAKRDREEGFGIHLINKNQNLFVIWGDDVQELNLLFEQFFIIGKEYCENFVMSMSGVHQDFTEASKAYLEADEAFDNRFLVDNSRIIHFGGKTDWKQVELLPDMYLHRLKNAIRSREETEAGKVIGEICDCLRSSQHSLLTFRILYSDIIRMMIMEGNNHHSDFANIYNVFALSQCLSIDDFNDILREVSRRLMENKGASDHKKTDMVAEAIAYMKANYQNAELNMSALADYLKISGVTLAVEFKNAMGISPSDYLAIIRMENAKTLLKETQLRVKEISAAIGYEDDHVFMRRFKKYVGKTPGQYRMEV